MKWFTLLLLVISGIAGGQPITVMTYNIRYDNSEDGKDRWLYRKEHLVNQLRFYEPAILGIQEGLVHQVKYLKEQLSNYHYFGVGREDGMEGGEFSAVYYLTEDFRVLEKRNFWLSLTPEKPSTGWDAALPRLCTYGLFERKLDSRQFWVFNTHFDHAGHQARIESMRLILEKIQELNKSGDLPVILMGDFNSTPSGPVIQEMKKALSDSREIAGIVFGPDATFNDFQFHKTPKERIDYVAVSGQLKVLKYAVLTDSNNQHYISDHFPVFCSLTFED